MASRTACSASVLPRSLPALPVGVTVQPLPQHGRPHSARTGIGPTLTERGLQAGRSRGVARCHGQPTVVGAGVRPRVLLRRPHGHSVASGLVVAAELVLVLVLVLV